jgi:hypothetical protein
VLASSSVPDGLAHENDVDSTRILLVDLQELADEAVHAVGRHRTTVFEWEAVLVDALTRRLEIWNELVCPPMYSPDAG